MRRRRCRCHSGRPSTPYLDSTHKRLQDALYGLTEEERGSGEGER